MIQPIDDYKHLCPPKPASTAKEREMTDYTPSDFSPIFGPDDPQPTRPGWYISTGIWPDILETIHEGKKHPRDAWFGFWDGDLWRIEPNGSFIIQQRYWFGLNKKP